MPSSVRLDGLFPGKSASEPVDTGVKQRQDAAIAKRAEIAELVIGAAPERWVKIDLINRRRLRLATPWLPVRPARTGSGARSCRSSATPDARVAAKCSSVTTRAAVHPRHCRQSQGDRSRPARSPRGSSNGSPRSIPNARSAVRSAIRCASRRSIGCSSVVGWRARR